jgi:hypothetical protein
MSMYAIVKDPRRGERQVGDKPPAQMTKDKSRRRLVAANGAFE